MSIITAGLAIIIQGEICNAHLLKPKSRQLILTFYFTENDSLPNLDNIFDIATLSHQIN